MKYVCFCGDARSTSRLEAATLKTLLPFLDRTRARALRVQYGTHKCIIFLVVCLPPKRRHFQAASEFGILLYAMLNFEAHGRFLSSARRDAHPARRPGALGKNVAVRVQTLKCFSTV